MLLSLSVVLLPSVVWPTVARAAQVALGNDGSVVPILPSGQSQSPAHRAAHEAARLRVDEYVGTQSLPPVRELSAESVIGTDDRTQVTDTEPSPNSAIAHLIVEFPVGSFTCTGWFIAADRVATAGHCIYGSGNGGFATSIMVIPGRNGGTAPFGSFAAANWYVPRKWKRTENWKFDYGVITLGSNVGETVGFFGVGVEDDAFLDKLKIKVRGFPGDKPFGTMWTMNGKIKELSPTRFFYPIDTAGGESGSPAFGRNGACDPCGFGIHTYGVGGTVTNNSATRITSTVFDFLFQAGTP